MPEPTKIPRPFADSGDKNSIPDSSGGLGFASWQEGFPAITGTPFAQGGVAPKRADFNGIFNALSLATVWQQQGGVYAYDNTTDYEVGNVVLYSGDLFKCITANGPSSAVKAPTDTSAWQKIMSAADVAANYLAKSTITTGTWTPVIYGTTTAGTYTSSNVHGFYTKIGRLVFVNAAIDIQWLTQPAGNARISGFPFTFRETNFGLYYDGSGTMAGSTRIKAAVGIKNNNIAYIFAMNKDNSTNGQASFATSESGTSMVASVNSTLFSTLTGCYITD